MKLLIKLFIALLFVGLLLIGGSILFAGKLVKAAVEKGGTYALGVPTVVDDVELGFFSGEFGLSGFSVANPDGFAEEHFMSLRDAQVELGMATLTSDRIEAPLLLIEGFSISLERHEGKTNYGVILENLEKLQKEGDATDAAPAEDEAGGEGPKLLIHEIVLRDITAHVDLVPLAGDKLKKSVTLKELRLEDVGDSGETLPQMIARLTTAVMQATLESLDGVIPPELLAQLQGDFQNLDQVKMQFEAEVQAQIDDAKKKLEEAADQAKKDAEKKVRDEVNDAVNEGLDKLFKKD